MNSGPTKSVVPTVLNVMLPHHFFFAGLKSQRYKIGHTYGIDCMLESQRNEFRSNKIGRTYGTKCDVATSLFFAGLKSQRYKIGHANGIDCDAAASPFFRDIMLDICKMSKKVP